MSERARLASQMLHKIKPPVRNESPGSEAVEVPSFEHLRLTRDEERVATDAYKKTTAGAELTKPEQFALEAIILPDIRPAIDIRNGSYAEVTHPEWRKRLNDAATRARIEAAIRSVGRVELPGDARPYGGTAFVVGPGLLMTNRHVAALFTTGLGRKNLNFVTGRGARIDFARDPDGDETHQLSVRATQMIHPYWDMALLRVDGLDDAHPALSLLGPRADDYVDCELAVIGYPAFDPFGPRDVQDRVFNGRYEVKRLMPGKGRPREQVQSFDTPVQAFTHEASTLGGASGSAVVDLDTGHVIALHFGGAYLRANYAVPAWELSRDARVVDAGVNFVAPSADAETTQKWWASVESGEERPSETSGRGAKTMDQKNADGVITITIPLEITVRLGAAGAEAVARGAARTESVAAAAPAENDPAAPGEGEVSEIVDMETARAFANRGVGVFEEAVTAPSVTLEGVARLLTLDMRAAKDFLDACTHSSPRVTYGLGAKAKHGAKPGKDFKKIDCSGFVRELIWRSTSPSFNFPDGSVVQHQWIRDNGFARSKPAEARSTDDIVRIAFLRPQDTSSGIGHVVVIYKGMTLESHGGVGPDSRPWTATGWQASTYVYVLSES